MEAVDKLVGCCEDGKKVEQSKCLSQVTAMRSLVAIAMTGQAAVAVRSGRSEFEDLLRHTSVLDALLRDCEGRYGCSDDEDIGRRCRVSRAKGATMSCVRVRARGMRCW
jgi:hypothetical protein